MRQGGSGYVGFVLLLFAGLDAESEISDDTKQIWKELLVRELSMALFARAEDVNEIRLEDL
jgi:hypothetical protein